MEVDDEVVADEDVFPVLDIVLVALVLLEPNPKEPNIPFIIAPNCPFGLDISAGVERSGVVDVS